MFLGLHKSELRLVLKLPFFLDTSLMAPYMSDDGMSEDSSVVGSVGMPQGKLFVSKERYEIINVKLSRELTE